MSLLKEMASMDIEEGFKEILDYREHPEALDCDPNAFEQVARSRRSVRVFDQSVPVPEEVIQKSLDLAMLAPNSSNLQPWEFYWVRSPEKKAELVQWCMSQPAARTASDLIVVVARTKTWRRNCNAIYSKLKADTTVPRGALNYYRLTCPMVYTQAWNLFSIVKHFMFNIQGISKPMPREPNFYSGMRLWATKSTSLAAATFMLAIRSHGYDTCPMEGCDQKRIKQLLGLPKDAMINMVIGVGKRTDKGVYGQQVRLPRAWFVKEV
jgi:nitroreductase